GGASRREAESKLDAGNRSAEPVRLLRSSAKPEADARHAAGRFQGHGTEDWRSGNGAESYLLSPLSNARIRGRLVRGGRCARRKSDHLLPHAGRLAPAQ